MCPELPGERGGGPSVTALRRRLLPWYRRHRRPLPWRATRDPYRVWVSEIMLQQTQVATVRPFYQRFLERFPTLASLARAREADVLAQWSGLGYYRRARHLLEAARRVRRDHGGRVPDDPDRFSALPGVGRYTAGAVLSIAFDRPLPVLDGNVARVLSRLFALRLTTRDARGAARLWRLAATLVPMRRPGEWNQALMELGATVCLPRAPRCAACPLRAECRARARDRVAEYPPVPERRAPERLRRAVALIERDGRLLMVRRSGALLDGLWEPPGVELEPGERPEPRLREALRGLGVQARLGAAAGTVRQQITHRAITVEAWRAELRGPVIRSIRGRFIDPRGRGVPLTALARKLAALAEPRRDRSPRPAPRGERPHAGRRRAATRSSGDQR